MTRYVCVAIMFGFALFSSGAGSFRAVLAQQAGSASSVAPSPVSAERAFLDQYCVTCHNQRSQTAGVMFDTMDAADVSKQADVWERTVRKLHGRMMPPPGARQPDRNAAESFVSWLESSLDRAAETDPNPGSAVLHRLNRSEYANAIEDLLGLQIDAASLLPEDDISDGFDNIASVLKVSPSFLDQYITAARMISLQAVGHSSPQRGSTTLRAAPGADQGLYIEGLPLGTRGGLLAEHFFPADGEYQFNISLGGALEHAHTLIMTINGAKVFEERIGGESDLRAADQLQVAGRRAIADRFNDIRLSLKGGYHNVGVTFIARSLAASDNALHSFNRSGNGAPVPTVSSVQVTGPFSPAGENDSPSRQRIFICRPATPDEELSCATRILSEIATRAFRRPATEEDMAAPLAFYKAARETGDFDAGIQSGLMVILASPRFLYRAEPVPENHAPGSIYRINDLELASRLSFFLWSRMPDTELLETAVEGRLSNPDVLEQQVRRMLADPRSKSLVTNFAFQWLRVRDLENVTPDPFLFPSFNGSLRIAFRREMELFIESLLREDRSVVDLLAADYTYVNEHLARHYGIPNVRGNEFRRVTLADSNRWGLLGKGSILMVTSYPDRTAPVIRGAWILENLLGTPPPVPPPDVEGLVENEEGGKVLTVRERMEIHRANPTCNSCHGIMDPLGFALENFDAVGEWRTRDRWAGTAIDASGQLADGTPIGGPSDLRQALTERPEQFVQTMTEKLLTYALGRSVEYYDMPAVRKIVRDAAVDNYRFSSIVKGIVRSAPFQMKKVSGETE